MNNKGSLGKYKTWVNRLQTYLGPLNFMMILYLYIKQDPLDIIWQVWVVIIGVLLSVLLMFDLFFVFPSELGYGSKKNPEWMGLRDEIKEIRSILLMNNKEMKK